MSFGAVIKAEPRIFFPSISTVLDHSNFRVEVLFEDGRELVGSFHFPWNKVSETPKKITVLAPSHIFTFEGGQNFIMFNAGIAMDTGQNVRALNVGLIDEYGKPHGYSFHEYGFAEKITFDLLTISQFADLKEVIK